MKYKVVWLFSRLFGHPNQTTSSELETLCRVANSAIIGRHGVRILEIGSWMGCSSVYLAKIAQKHNGRLFCCDTWCGEELTKKTSFLLTMHGAYLYWFAKWWDVYGSFWRRIGRAKLKTVVISLRGLSQDVLPILADKTFDVIFIDGDHRYEYVKFDIEQARRLIRSGGVIVGHDYTERSPGVYRAVHDIFGEIKHVGLVWWVAQAS